ncbi:MAG: hypothetical protein ABIN01_17785 [Ferruginibacter sp.]
MDLISDIEKSAFKKRLLDICKGVIEQRIASGVAAIANAQAAANEEEKSSAGDKYETSRAMSHLEKDMHARQLTANNAELAALFNINCARLYHAIAKGSFVDCGDCCFFIAAGLGKISFEGRNIYVVAPAAPVAKLLFQKKQNEVILFNERELSINDVY